MLEYISNSFKMINYCICPKLMEFEYFINANDPNIERLPDIYFNQNAAN